MAVFVVRRMGGAVVTFLVATVVIFTLTFALPGDPARVIAGRKASEATLAAIRVKYHLDQSLPTQYARWVGRLLRGDLGESIVSRRAVVSILRDALPVTMTLMAATVLIELVLGAGLGVLVGMRRGGALDRAVVVLCVLGIASPLFVLASLAQYLFGVRWGLLPVAGVDDGLIGYVLPSMVLATIGGSFAVRLMRVETLDQLNLPHVRTARSKGISERQLTRNHVARNAMTALVTFFGLEIGALLGGTVVVERVFNLAGVGGVLGRAISQRDNVVIIGFTVFVVVVYLALDVLIDVVTMLLDPRTRVS